jgi:dienelactone hydrolase
LQSGREDSGCDPLARNVDQRDIQHILARDYVEEVPAHGAAGNTMCTYFRERKSRDLWSLGVLYYESLAGRVPFRGESNLATLRAIAEQRPPTLRQFRPDTPPLAERIVTRALQKNSEARYQSASEIVKDTSELLSELTASHSLAIHQKKSRRGFALISMAALLILAVAGIWFYGNSRREWAREDAVPQINTLLTTFRPLGAMLVLEKAQHYLPDDPQLKQIAADNTTSINITSSPAGAKVEIQDYAFVDSAWHTLGLTPLRNVLLPKGYFRWRISKPGAGEEIVAPVTVRSMDFPLEPMSKSPDGMVYVPGGKWGEQVGVIGWLGPYDLPAYYVDRYEVSNTEFQRFVDSGGYQDRKYWPREFIQDGRPITWDEAMAQFRDSTGRPGPATWTGGHFPEGKGDYPVSGVSWFEASAYAAFAGKSLPILAQWFKTAAPQEAAYTVQLSNMNGSDSAPRGAYKGVGPYGTYDTAGNVREWVANATDGDLRFILGGDWESPPYRYTEGEALSPFDRGAPNGIRCVQNLGPIPEQAASPVAHSGRDFSHFKPASDEVFRAYQTLYSYPNTPLNATEDGLVQETVDWREEKVSFDTGYRGERMSAYLYLPKNVRPPYQTVLFFPSARVEFIASNKGGLNLGDQAFFDYVIQSGRAVMYPIYQDTYERRLKFSLPGGAQNIQLTTDWYKDAARSLDYLSTRSDINRSKFAYLGVSMGSADGTIIATLLQDRLKTVVFLDGGYFLDTPPPGGDQADFVPRLKKPVLMVNGRYDFTFPLDASQNPLFNMLATPAADKRHIVLDSPHDVTQQRPELTKAVLNWLDQYMGRVN